MTFQTLILTGPESNLRAPRSLLSERLKYRQVVHNVSCLLLYKARHKTRKKKNGIKSSVIRFVFFIQTPPGSGANPHQYECTTDINNMYSDNIKTLQNVIFYCGPCK